MPVLSTITRETDDEGNFRSETYKTERGLSLAIEYDGSGLYGIRPLGGGIPPVICQERFTSHLEARQALIRYIEKTDRNGYAEHPEKPKESVRKGKNG